jgi:hypothetical protein
MLRILVVNRLAWGRFNAPKIVCFKDLWNSQHHLHHNRFSVIDSLICKVFVICGATSNYGWTGNWSASCRLIGLIFNDCKIA